MGFNDERYRITSCKDCQDRYPGCHGKCEKYIQQRADYDKLKDENMKRYQVAYGLYQQRSNSVHKANARKQYRDKYR